jgi:long-chain acyl-CoA synthetase
MDPVQYFNKLKDYDKLNALAYYENKSWQKVTYSELTTLILQSQVAHYFQFNRAVVITDNSADCGLLILTSLVSGKSMSPIDSRLTINEIQKIVDLYEPEIIFHADILQSKIKILETRAKKFVIEDLPLWKLQDHNILTPNLLPGELICFTSGTSGESKGVIVKWENLAHQITALNKAFKIEQGRFLSILPINHMFEITGGFLYPLSIGCEVFYLKSILPSELITNIQDNKITNMVIVPLVLESFYTGFKRKLQKKSRLEQLLFKILFSLAPLMNMKIKKIFFKEIHKIFGDHFSSFTVGGAPLSPFLERFFRRVGVNIDIGYGLSETAPVCTVSHHLDDTGAGVGKAIENVNIKIEKKSTEDNDGIIHIKGPNVTSGYYKNIQLTKEVIDSEGWFNTGDIGYLDAFQNLHISGREKNLIVLKGGKKIQPEEIEHYLSPLLPEEKFCVVSLTDKQDNVTIVLVLTRPEVPDAEERKKLNGLLQQLKNNLADYKIPQKIAIIKKELPLTHTKKIERKKVANLITQEETLWI